MWLSLDVKATRFDGICLPYCLYSSYKASIILPSIDNTLPLNPYFSKKTSFRSTDISTGKIPRPIHFHPWSITCPPNSLGLFFALAIPPPTPPPTFKPSTPLCPVTGKPNTSLSKKLMAPESILVLESNIFQLPEHTPPPLALNFLLMCAHQYILCLVSGMMACPSHHKMSGSIYRRKMRMFHPLTQLK